MDGGNVNHAYYVLNFVYLYIIQFYYMRMMPVWLSKL